MLRHPLAWEVTLLLTFKAILMSALFLLFFSPGHRPIVTPQVMENALTAPFPTPPSSQPEAR